MKAVAVTAAGEKIALPAPVSFRFCASAGVPADSFTGTFPMIKSPGTVSAVRVFTRNGVLLFDGMTDEQDETASGGLLLTLRARGRAALLLDSEAMPQSYAYPSLPVIFARHLAPYGFTAYRGSDRVYEGALTVEKGMSEWQVAARFCERFLKTEPRVRGTVFDASGSEPGKSAVFGLPGIRYVSLSVKRRPCDLISEVFRLQDGGKFVSAAREKEAEELGILRRRFSASPGADAAGLLRQKEKRVFETVLDCAGEPPAELYEKAEVRGSALGTFSGLFVAQTEYLLDSGGEHCRVTLRRERN